MYEFPLADDPEEQLAQEAQTMPTFVLMHGSLMRPQHWESVEAELESQGYPTYAAELNLDDPSSDAQKCGKYVADQLRERGDDDIVLVAHSRSGNIAPWTALKVPVSQIIFVAASFEKPTIDCITRAGDPPLPNRNPNGKFKKAIKRHTGSDMTWIEREDAAELFFNACSNPSELDIALEGLRETRRSRREPRLPHFPSHTPLAYLRGQEDKVISKKWAAEVCKRILRVKLIEMPGADHCPMVSCPAQLADLLTDLANERRIPV